MFRPRSLEELREWKWKRRKIERSKRGDGDPKLEHLCGILKHCFVSSLKKKRIIDLRSAREWIVSCCTTCLR